MRTMPRLPGLLACAVSCIHLKDLLAHRPQQDHVSRTTSVSGNHQLLPHPIARMSPKAAPHIASKPSGSTTHRTNIGKHYGHYMLSWHVDSEDEPRLFLEGSFGGLLLQNIQALHTKLRGSNALVQPCSLGIGPREEAIGCHKQSKCVAIHQIHTLPHRLRRGRA